MRPILHRLLTGVLSLQLMACSQWPQHGQGGMAERFEGTLMTIEAGAALTYQHGLRLDYESQQQRLDILLQQGARECFPAHVAKAETLEVRIIRSLHGGLYPDAANDLVIQRQSLAMLERNLEYVIQHQACTPPSLLTSDTERDSIDRLMTLLNSDNQFALNSYELNPKYISRLEKAVKILEISPTLYLYIVGHTDVQGSSQENHFLSQRRAMKVAEFLVNRGIARHQLFVLGQGGSLNAYPGDQDHIHLVNRRVNVLVSSSTIPGIRSE